MRNCGCPKSDFMVPGNMSAESSVSWFHKKLIFQKYLSKFKHFDWVMAKLVLILANQIVQSWEISFGKLAFMKSINRSFCNQDLLWLHLLLCTDVCHIWSTVNQSICIFYRHQLYYTLVCSMFVSNDFSNCSFGYQWQVHSCENFLFVFS